jgi:hypothetical protein
MVLAEAPTVYEFVGVVTPAAAGPHLERRTSIRPELIDQERKWMADQMIKPGLTTNALIRTP